MGIEKVIPGFVKFIPTAFFHRKTEELRYWINLVPDRKSIRTLSTENIRQMHEEVRKKLPTRADHELLSPFMDIENFAKKEQADDKRGHDKIHLAITSIFAGINATEYNVLNPNLRPANVFAAIVAANIHDIRRKIYPYDMIFMSKHGKKAAKMAPEFIEKWSKTTQTGITVDNKTVDLIKGIVLNHDNFGKIPEAIQNDPTFQAVILADSLGMMRFLETFNKKGFFMARNLRYGAIDKKLFEQPFLNELRQRYAPIAAELIIRSHESLEGMRVTEETLFKTMPNDDPRYPKLIRRIENRDYRFAVVMNVAEEMGLLGKTDQLTDFTTSFNV